MTQIEDALLVRLMIYAADLAAWYQMPWYQRILTPKPKEPA